GRDSPVRRRRAADPGRTATGRQDRRNRQEALDLEPSDLRSVRLIAAAGKKGGLGLLFIAWRFLTFWQECVALGADIARKQLTSCPADTVPMPSAWLNCRL